MKKIALALAILGVLGVGTWIVNYAMIGRRMAEVLSADQRNAGLTFDAHFASYLNPQVLVVDLRGVSSSNSPTDVFRALLQLAAASKTSRYSRVELAHRGQTKFLIPGEYFLQLGNEYGEQNPVYTIRTFPEHLLRPDGSSAYGSWSGGWLGVLKEQMNDFDDFHRRWYINDLATFRESNG